MFSVVFEPMTRAQCMRNRLVSSWKMVMSCELHQSIVSQKCVVFCCDEKSDIINNCKICKCKGVDRDDSQSTREYWRDDEQDDFTLYTMH